MSEDFVHFNYLPHFKGKIRIGLDNFLREHANDEATPHAAGNEESRSFTIVMRFQGGVSPAFRYYIFDNQKLKVHGLDKFELRNHYYMKSLPIWPWQQETACRASQSFPFYDCIAAFTLKQEIFWNTKVGSI